MMLRDRSTSHSSAERYMAGRRGRPEDGYSPDNVEELVNGKDDPAGRVASDILVAQTNAGSDGPLPEYFSAEDSADGQNWLLRCKKCGQGYRLAKSSRHIGNRQKLLMHARSHSDLEQL